jgi:hypothetical protein
MAPLAAGAHDVEQAVQQTPHVRGARPTSGLGPRDQRSKQAELIIAERLAGPKVPNQSAIRECPHQRPPDGKILLRTVAVAIRHHRSNGVSLTFETGCKEPKDKYLPACA